MANKHRYTKCVNTPGILSILISLGPRQYILYIYLYTQIYLLLDILYVNKFKFVVFSFFVDLNVTYTCTNQFRIVRVHIVCGCFLQKKNIFIAVYLVLAFFFSSFLVNITKRCINV